MVLLSTEYDNRLTNNGNGRSRFGAAASQVFSLFECDFDLAGLPILPMRSLLRQRVLDAARLAFEDTASNSDRNRDQILFSRSLVSRPFTIGREPRSGEFRATLSPQQE